MSVLLFIVGAIVTMLGLGMVAYGIPINEFSFGNTLIVAGTTAAVGGLIIVGIASAIGQLKRIAVMLASRTPARSNRSLELFEPLAEPPAPPMPVPFPPKPKSAVDAHEPHPSAEVPAAADAVAEDRAEALAAPALQNPEIAAPVAAEYGVEAYEEISLSPRQPLPAPAPADLGEPPLSVSPAPVAEKRIEPAFEEASWRFPPPSPSPPQERPAQPSHFDAMWPAESNAAKRPLVEEPKPEPPSPMAATPAAPEPASAPPVAILKSGVVDGMGYTLYVDGSIEAELPQGTLHFASINELREHLAKNS